MRPLIAALVLAWASTSVAHAAAILGAGPGHAQPGSKVIECWLNNAGNTNVTISTMKIIHETSGAILPSYECKGNLPALRSCYTYAFVEDNAAYACKVVVSDRTNVRGSLQITDSDAVVLFSEPLR